MVPRLFPELAGKNFQTYLEDLRMAEAMKRLQSPRRTVDEVATGVGYASSHAFRRAFKRRFGFAPSAVVASPR